MILSDKSCSKNSSILQEGLHALGGCILLLQPLQHLRGHSGRLVRNGMGCQREGSGPFAVRCSQIENGPRSRQVAPHIDVDPARSGKVFDEKSLIQEGMLTGALKKGAGEVIGGTELSACAVSMG